MLTLWLEKRMFKVTEQRLVNRANVLKRGKWTTESGVEEITSDQLDKKRPGSRKDKRQPQAIMEPQEKIIIAISIRKGQLAPVT